MIKLPVASPLKTMESIPTPTMGIHLASGSIPDWTSTWPPVAAQTMDVHIYLTAHWRNSSIPPGGSMVYKHQHGLQEPAWTLEVFLGVSIPTPPKKRTIFHLLLRRCAIIHLSSMFRGWTCKSPSLWSSTMPALFSNSNFTQIHTQTLNWSTFWRQGQGCCRRVPASSLPLEPYLSRSSWFPPSI